MERWQEVLNKLFGEKPKREDDAEYERFKKSFAEPRRMFVIIDLCTTGRRRINVGRDREGGHE